MRNVRTQNGTVRSFADHLQSKRIPKVTTSIPTFKALHSHIPYFSSCYYTFIILRATTFSADFVCVHNVCALFLCYVTYNTFTFQNFRLQFNLHTDVFLYYPNDEVSLSNTLLKLLSTNNRGFSYKCVIILQIPFTEIFLKCRLITSHNFHSCTVHLDVISLLFTN